DKNLVPNRGRILVEAVVIAGNRARADVAFRSDLGVTQVREVHRFGTFADGAFLQFDEIANARAGLQVIVRAQPRRRTDNDAIVEGLSATTQCGSTVTPSPRIESANTLPVRIVHCAPILVLPSN